MKLNTQIPNLELNLRNVLCCVHIMELEKPYYYKTIIVCKDRNVFIILAALTPAKKLISFFNFKTGT